MASPKATSTPQMERWIPEALKAPGIWELHVWQLVALPLLGVLALGLGALLGGLSRRLFVRITSRTRGQWDDEVAGHAGGPLTLAWGVVAMRMLIPVLELADRPHQTLDRWLGVGLLVGLFWLLYRIVAVVAGHASRSPWSVTHPTARAFVPLAARIARIVVFGLAVVTILAQLGYPVASLVAGLGLGGVAVALAAKSTLENLFGAFALGTDQPFQVGDFVKVDATMGNVETIGLRSTRIRTQGRTLVTIPNGKLADMAIETFAVRDRLNLACTVPLVYSSTVDQIRRVLGELEAVLLAQPKIQTDGITVKLRELARESIDLEVNCWFLTTDWVEFQSIRQDVLLRFMEVIEAAGTSLARPTRTVHVVDERPRAPVADPNVS